MPTTTEKPGLITSDSLYTMEELSAAIAAWPKGPLASPPERAEGQTARPPWICSWPRCNRVVRQVGRTTLRSTPFAATGPGHSRHRNHTMTVVSDITEIRKLTRCRTQPCLNFLPFAAHEMLADLHAHLFPDICHAIALYFVTRGPLACVVFSEDAATIYIHQLLNHPDTPAEVITWILKHELLHLRIPPISINGKEVQHPPRFWEAEKAFSRRNISIGVDLD